MSGRQKPLEHALTVSSGPASIREDALPPRTMVDHFAVVRVLGRGGMGEVYLARDTQLGRKVALKVIHRDHLGQDPEARARFLDEARATARFNHPNIVTIYAAGVHQERPYVALEYIEGEDLRTRLAESNLARMEALRIALAIAQALVEAHRHGIHHRDLKPENIVIARDGRPRVVDFGLAHAAADSPEAGLDGATPLHTARPAGLTTPVGTPEYMAPEQWLLTEISPAVDVWAFGVVLFEMLTGVVPYARDGGLAALARKVCSMDPAPRAAQHVEVAAEIDHLVGRCLEKDPELRPSAEELVERLGALLSGSSEPGDEEEEIFRGLLAFDERHRHAFFGRDAEIAAVVERLRHTPVLPVVGSSGAGKSSLLLAGVVPRLREQGYGDVIVLRPGASPFRALATRVTSDRRLSTAAAGPALSVGTPSAIDDLALRLAVDPRALSRELRERAETLGYPVVLIVDQLEELFTLTDDEDLQRRFMTAICTACDDWADPVRVMFTVRDDYLGRIAVAPAVRDVMSSVVVVRPLDAAMSVRVLEQTVAQAGYRFEDPTLPQRMVDDIGAAPGALPLLQFAAQLLWRRRDEDRRLLLTSAYAEMGGATGALAGHADGLLSSLAPEERAAVKRMLCRLVTPERTRRRLPRARAEEGLDAAVASRVMERLVAGRLLALHQGERGEVAVELAHEALITRWATLAGWLDEGREDLAWLAEVGEAAERWERRGCRDDELWQGELLREGMKMLSRSRDAPARVRDFLQRGERRRVSARRRRQLLVIAAAVALVMTSVVLFLQREEADEQRGQAEAARAEASERHAEAARQAARAALESGRLVDARALVRAALEQEDAPAARALWWRLSREPTWWEVDVDSLVYDLAFSPDGRWLAAATQGGVVLRVDVATKKRTAFRGHRHQVFSLAFSKDGKALYSGSWGGEVAAWDAERGRLLHLRADAHRAGVRDLALSPDGTRLASSGDAGRVVLWRLPELTPERTLELATAQMGVGFVDDATLLTGGQDGKLRLWNVSDGSRRAELTVDAMRGLALSPSRDAVLVGGADGSAKLWSLPSGALQATIARHKNSVRGLSFSPDGRTLTTGSRADGLHLWTTDGKPLERRRFEEGVMAATFAPRGRHVAVAAYDRIVVTRTGSEQEHLSGHHKGAQSAVFSPDGSRLATGGQDHLVVLWDASTGKVLRQLEGHAETVDALAFADDRELVTASSDRTVRLWDTQSGAETGVLSDAEGELRALALSPDRQLIAAAGRTSGAIYLWDRRSRALRTVLEGDASDVMRLAFDPAGERLVAVHRAAVEVWDVAGKKRLSRHARPGHELTRAALWDGQTLLVAADDGLWRLRDDAWASLAATSGERHFGLALRDNDVLLAGEHGRLRVIDRHGDGLREDRRLHPVDINEVVVDAASGRSATVADDASLRLWERDGRPYWRAPALLASPARLLTHRGWSGLEGDVRGSTFERMVAERARLVREHAPSQTTCLWTHAGEVELHVEAPPRKAASLPEARAITAVAGGCAAMVGEGVTLLTAEGPQPVETTAPQALGVAADGTLLLADEVGIARVASGQRRSLGEPVTDATALAAAGEAVFVGHRDGALQRVGGRLGAFADTPASPVTALHVGPGGTLVAGYANGVVGLWDVATGRRIEQTDLHGPIAHLLVEGARLHAASALGDHRTWDLTALVQPYCELMRAVWADAPAVMSDGVPAVMAPPASHTCAP